jgi:hypothetical protein
MVLYVLTTGVFFAYKLFLDTSLFQQKSDLLLSNKPTKYVLTKSGSMYICNKVITRFDLFSVTCR